MLFKIDTNKKMFSLMFLSGFLLIGCTSNDIDNTSEDSLVGSTINHAPIAKDISHKIYEDAMIDITLEATDQDKNDILRYILVKEPSYGSLVENDNIWTYKPQANYFGKDSFVYKVCDDKGACSSTATVFLDILAINDAPIFKLKDKVPYFIEHMIGEKAFNSIFSVDINDDSQVDIIAGGDSGVVWFDNNDMSFNEYNITTEYSAYSVYAVDMDLDGDIDVLSADKDDGYVCWYENDNLVFKEHNITKTDGFIDSIIGVDFDLDGDMDVVYAGISTGVYIYENDGTSYISHLITDYGDVPKAQVSDLDKDGDLDIIVSDWQGDKFVWFEQTQSYEFVEHNISSTPIDGPRSAYVADLDKDGDLDIVSSASAWDDDSNLTWYENDGSQNFVEHAISQEFVYLIDTGIVDIDNDGDLDLLASSYGDDKIAWYENDGKASFVEHIVSLNTDGAWEVHHADINGDGKMDMLASAGYVDYIPWFEQKSGYIVKEGNTSVMKLDAIDVDGDKLSFSILGEDKDIFDINQTTNELMFKEIPDFENPVDSNADNVYEITIQVTDGKLEEQKEIQIYVENLNDE